MRKYETPQPKTTLSPTDSLIAVVSKWVTTSQELGHATPFSRGVYKFPLVAEDGTQITLHMPTRHSGEPSTHTEDMGYTTSAMATIEDQGVQTTLHVTPNYVAVLSSKDGELVKPPITEDAFLKLVLNATVQKPE